MFRGSSGDAPRTSGNRSDRILKRVRPSGAASDEIHALLREAGCRLRIGAQQSQSVLAQPRRWNDIAREWRSRIRIGDGPYAVVKDVGRVEQFAEVALLAWPWKVPALSGSAPRVAGSTPAPTEKKSLLRSELNFPGMKTGPLMSYPNWLNRNGAGPLFSLTFGLRFGVQVFAFSAELRKFSTKFPWKSRPPLFVTKRICPADDRPYFGAVVRCQDLNFFDGVHVLRPEHGTATIASEWQRRRLP